MSAENAKVMLRRVFEEGLNQNRADVLKELIGPTYVNHDMPMTSPGAAGFEQVIGMFRAAFPDLRITLEDVFADGDKVGSRGYMTGTQKGGFMGVPGTGKSVRVPYQDLWRIENGKFVENWVRIDMLGLMQQIGAVPAPSRA